MKLVHKLFATSLLTSMVIVVTLLVIMPYLASRHFADYLAKVQMEQLTSLITILKAEYGGHQGWNNLKQNPRLWDQLLGAVRDNTQPHPLPPLPPGYPIHVDENVPGHLSPPPLPYPHIIRRLSLFDDQKHLVAGMAFSPERMELREIVYQSKTVGWVGFQRPNLAEDPLLLNFLYKQIEALFFVGCGIIILAALVAFILSRHLLRPVQQISLGARALASRRFETRIDTHSADELGELAADFNKMANTLERYEYMRRRWISDISHELRTPLAVLRGEVEAVLDGVREMRKETLESFHAEVMLLTKIVNDLHSLTIIESEAMTMAKEPVKILQVVTDILGAFQTRFAENNLEIVNDLPPDTDLIVLGDADRLAQVFSNIFENTLRYTDAPGKVRIRHARKSDSISILIEDSSPGVSDSALPFIFERLYRVDSSRSRTKGGSGLGLAICKAIIENLGGKIIATHSPLGGLLIEITLPLFLKNGKG